jgi:lipopolysaccharide export system protein LptA
MIPEKPTETLLYLKSKATLFPFVMFMVLLVPLINMAASGSRLELLHSDISKGEMVDGRPLRILQGNVHARQDSLELFCDRAVYDETEKILTLKGNVHLYRGQDTLLAREVRYFEVSKIAIAEGKVEVFRPLQRMKCNFLEYYYETDKIRASGHLFLHDMENRVYITGGKGEYIPEQKYSYVQDKAHFWRIDSTSNDTLNIYSRIMEYQFGVSRKAIAQDSVRIIQENLHATCDSAIYHLDQDMINLKGGPLAIQENNKISGREMQMFLENQELRKIMVTEGARAISITDTVLQKENRLEGRSIVMYIANRKLNELQAISNARSFYHLKEGDQDQGINVASADTIKAFFKNNEIDSIAVIGGAQGIFYPDNYKGPIKED